MIRLIIRSGLLVCAIIGMGVYAGMGGISYVASIVFLCAWLTVKDFKIIGWWVIALAAIFSIGWHDQWGIYFLMMIFAAYTFNVIHSQLIRSNNNSIVWLFLSTLAIAFIADSIAKFVSTHHLAYDSIVYITTLFTSVFAFFVFVWGIRICERFIDLYAHDVQGHT